MCNTAILPAKSYKYIVCNYAHLPSCSITTHSQYYASADTLYHQVKGFLQYTFPHWFNREGNDNDYEIFHLPSFSFLAENLLLSNKNDPRQTFFKNLIHLTVVEEYASGLRKPQSLKSLECSANKSNPAHSRNWQIWRSGEENKRR